MKTIWALVILMTLAMFVNTAGLVGCSSSSAKTAADVIEKAKVPAFNGAVAAFVLLDEAEAHRLAAMPSATPEQIAAAEQRVRRLEVAEAALGELRQWLSGENKDLDARGKMREVVDALDLVVKGLKNEKLAVPTHVDEALSAARLFL